MKTTLAPRLRHRIDIEAPVTTIDPSNGARSTAWVSIRALAEPLIPAELVPLSGRQFVAAQAVQAGVSARITIRWRPGLHAAMRIVHEGLHYNIRAILPDPTGRRHLSLMVEVGINAG